MAAPFALDAFDDELSREVKSILERVERRLGQACTFEDDFIADMGSHLAKAGGKRFRPMVLALSALLGRPTDDIIDAAVAVELTHLATLYHDDVMDEAPRRRGTESANQRWGNTLAILTGDVLFARTSEILAGLGPEAVRLQATTFRRLVEGQIHETVGPREGEDAVAHHIQVLSDKTGSLIANAARFGGLFSGLPTPALDALTEFGESVGLAFQIADDILDIASEAEVSGKTPGTDLREGIMTLPMLIVRATARPEDADLIALLGQPLHDDEEHGRALELMRSNPAMAAAQAEADRYAALAVAELQRLREMTAAVPADFGPAEMVEKVLTALEFISASTANRSV